MLLLADLLLASSVQRPAASVRRRPRGRRKGTVLILFAAMLIVLLGMLAFAIDIGVTIHHRASLQNAADASALAAAAVLERGQLSVNESHVRAAAAQYFTLNRPEATPEIELGRWDPVTRVFTPGTTSPPNVNAVRVRAEWQYPAYFGKVLGHESYRSGAEAIAIGGRDVAGPRDIVLLIDQTAALLTPRPDQYAAGEAAPADYPLNAKRALKEAAETFIDDVFTDYPDDRIGISGFADQTASEADLTDSAATLRDVFDISRPQALIFSYQKYLDEAGGRYPGETPRLGLALDGDSQGQVGGRQIATGTNSREDAKKILILVSDGSSLDDPDPRAVAVELAAAGFHIHTITVGDYSLPMQQLVVGDGRNHIVPTPSSSPSVAYADMLAAFQIAFDRIAGKESPPPKLVK
jgi:Tfp pilus assembly protein PilX